MRIARFAIGDKIAFGRVEGEQVHELRGGLFDAPETTGKQYALSQVRLLAPVNPAKLVCLGLNYRLHAQEVGLALPEVPMLFMCSPQAIIGPGEAIVLDSADQRIDFEAELAIVIGKAGHRIPVERAKEFVFGYTCANDVSNRDMQLQDGQFTRAKSFDTYKPMGPWISCGLDPDGLQIRLWQNDELRQSSSTADLIFPVDEIVAFVSGVMTLLPGDVIITGTPAGVGPMSAGDRIDIEIEGIGRLSNPVV